MNYTEIIEKLKEVYPNVYDFAFDDEMNYEFTEEELKADSLRKQFLEEEVNKFQHNTPEYKEAFSKYAKMPNKYDLAQKRTLEESGLGEIQEVEQYGGEGQGDTWYSVKYFPKHNVYIKVEGYYQSYNGTEFYDGWNSCRQVFPTQRTITVYE